MEDSNNIPLQDNMYNKPEEMNQNDTTPFTNDQQNAPPPMESPSYGVPPPQPMQEPSYNAMPEPKTNSNNSFEPQPQQQYGQPIANAVPSNGMPYTIVVNQPQQVAMVNPNMFKTSPIALNCTFCNKPITTTVNQEFNFGACCICFLTGLICYLIVQACRNKDLCFYDATHTCPYCGNVVGTYNAC